MTNEELLKGKQVLIVDDLADFRSALKRLVESCGAKEVNAAFNAEDALSNIQGKKYDVILCDYNLGNGKDGQQVLEELKFRGLLKAHQLFVMITAESTAEMVMGALEYEPDAYLVKPFNQAMLLARLERAFSLKNELLSINSALDFKQYEKALEACEVKLKSDYPQKQLVIKLKASTLMTLKRYQEAKTLYQAEMAERPSTWVSLGLGKACYELKEYEAAQSYLEDLINSNDHCPEALDWLAKIQLARNNPNEAQRYLEQALKISPKAIQRQQALADVALKNNDSETAEKALRSAVSLGKNSVYRKKEDSINLADKILAKLDNTGGGVNEKRLGDEAIAILEDVSSAFANDRNVQVQVAIYQGNALASLGRKEKAKAMMQRAEEMIKTYDLKLEPMTALNTAKTLIALGDVKKGEALLKELVANNPEDLNLIKTAQGIAETYELVVDEKTLNRQGIKLFESGKIQQSAELFEKAAQESPTNVALSLNAAQAYIQFMKKEGVTPERLAKAKEYLMVGSVLEKEDKRYERYVQLVRLFKGLGK